MEPDVEYLIRIAAGAALGGVIGYERERRGRQVGLRTHVLVAMAAATFMVVSAKFVYFQHYGQDDLIHVDPSRIAASVVTAIGFLAGGSIIRSGSTIQGLTTAAGLWLVTAIGMCAGGGMFIEAAAVTAMGFFVLTVMRRAEDRDDQVTRRRISLELGEDAVRVADVVKALQDLGAVVFDTDYDRRLDDKRRVSVTLDAKIPNSVGLDVLVAELEKQAGVRRVHVTTPT